MQMKRKNDSELHPRKEDIQETLYPERESLKTKTYMTKV